ncbi:hypothetical protein HYC85_015155 [Camellia sinensis]|uniref:Uncharacterized protein n=1 Tax=Camellia sinensis TaxID=4442 RepID=A0A7J7HBJ5_CAMSI|nr:hypothetical protein HYC85_015155 [Camellia sinensis]
MMRVAVWCPQSDFSRRPSINLDYNFTTPVAPRPITVVDHQGDAIGAATPLFASTLSGPSEYIKRGTDETEEDYLDQESLTDIISKGNFVKDNMDIVKIIGSTDHLNLARLVEHCVEKS